jgi:transcriptional regulator with XRE-family HTH domain
VSAGVTHTEVARRLKTTVHSYGDLERFDDEAFTVLSLEQLLDLGKALNVEPRVLLLGEEVAASTSTITFGDIAARLADRIAREGQTIDEFGDRIGWDVEPVLKDPTICTAAGLDWVAALPSLSGLNH